MHRSQPRHRDHERQQIVTANFLRRIYAPQNFTGTKKENRSLLLAQYFNDLKWQTHPDNINIEKYRVYLVEGGVRTLLTEVGAGTLEYKHWKVAKEKVYTYALAAVNNVGREGEAASISFK